MKKYIFQITLTEEDLAGDEFWEHVVKKNGTGIEDVTDVIRTLIDDANLLFGENTSADVVKLISYTDET